MAGNQLTDLGGRPIPPDPRYQSEYTPTLAIAPTYQAPDTASQEFLYTAFGTFLPASAVFVAMTDVVTNAAFAAQIDKNVSGRLASISIICPDMVLGTAPYLTIRLTINGQPAGAWGNVALPPIAGVQRTGFDANLMIQANALLGLSVLNADPAQSHYVQVQLYGWTWPA